MNDYIDPGFGLTLAAILLTAWFITAWRDTRPTTQHQDESEHGR
jgi:hypothetical protein